MYVKKDRARNRFYFIIKVDRKMDAKTAKSIEALRIETAITTTLVSYYLPPTANLNDARAKIRSELAEAANIKSKQTREGVLTSLNFIGAHLSEMKHLDNNGLALFAGQCI